MESVESPSPPPSPSSRWTVPLVLIAAGIAVSGFVWSGLRKSRLAANERAASTALKSLATAEADFRANDRDGNGVQDFWTADVKGLHDLVPVGSSEPMRLIFREVALADPTHPNAKPYQGYWFVAMERDENGKPYAQDTKGTGSKGRIDRDLTRFGFSAYPAEYAVSGTATFFINEGNTIFKEDLKGKTRTSWPTVDELRRYHTRTD